MSDTKIAASFRVSLTALMPSRQVAESRWLEHGALPCCAGDDAEAESASLRVDPSVYPRRVDHNTVTEGGIEDGARLARQDPFSDARPTAASLMITSL